MTKERATVLVPVDPDTYMAVEIIENLMIPLYGTVPSKYVGMLTRALEHLCLTGSIAVEEIKGGMN